ncbi:MAG: cell division topological specificity factor MinE [Eubacteriales bacterium]
MHKFPFRSNLTSVTIAKQRLKQLLYADRSNCTPELISQMKDDLYHTISKYIEIEPDHFELTLTRKEMYIKYVGEE